MKFSKHIDSPQNTEIKSLLQLQEKSKLRKKQGLFMLEGEREIRLALEANYKIQKIYICEALYQDKENLEFEVSIEKISISKNCYEKLAYRNSTEGIVVLVHTKSHLLSELQLPENPLILVAEAPEKPGNIGAILRTADAAKVDAVIIANPKADFYNPNAIRSSVGCVFTNQLASGTTEEVIDFLKARKISIYSAILQDAIPYTNVDFKHASAIVVGTEAEGLSQAWRTNSTQNIIIPMRGKIDSMNVSVATGILIFEAIRQRNL